MTDLSVVILTKNEKLHIKRCLEKLAPLEPRQIFIVDCFSTDGTKDIVNSFSDSNSELQLSFVERAWPGLYAKQFNWALDNLPIKASWVLRLDADEYLYPEAIEEVKGLLPKWDGEKVTGGGLPPDVTSLSLSLSRASFLRSQNKIWWDGTYPDGAFFQAWHWSLSRSRDGRTHCHKRGR